MLKNTCLTHGAVYAAFSIGALSLTACSTSITGFASFPGSSQTSSSNSTGSSTDNSTGDNSGSSGLSGSSGGSSGSSGGSSGPPWVGTKQLGVAGQLTEVLGVATDSSGDVFLGGFTTGGLDGNIQAGFVDFFVTKYDSSGIKQWTRQLGGAALQSVEGRSVTADLSGNVFVGGTTEGPSLDGNTVTGNHDFFVTKYNSSGTKQWTRLTGAVGQDTLARGVATDLLGNVFVVGKTDGGLDGNPANPAGEDLFITKYDSLGMKQWTKQLGVVGQSTAGLGVATDLSGNVFASGTTDGDLDGNISSGGQDFFITKYDSSGVKQWTKQMGINFANTYGQGVATDSLGNVFVGGYTTDGLDGNTLIGGTDLFVTKYSSSGVKQWTKQVGVAGQYAFGLGVGTDSSGNVLIGGYTTGGLDGNTQTGNKDYFVTKYSSSGVKQWTKQLGVTGQDTRGLGAAIDSSGSVFIGGYTTGGLDGNTQTGIYDAFVAKYSSSGVKQ